MVKWNLLKNKYMLALNILVLTSYPVLIAMHILTV